MAQASSNAQKSDLDVSHFSSEYTGDSPDPLWMKNSPCSRFQGSTQMFPLRTLWQMAVSTKDLSSCLFGHMPSCAPSWEVARWRADVAAHRTSEHGMYMRRYNCVILCIHIALIVNIIPDSERLSSKVHSILVATILNKHAVVQLPFWRLLPGGIEVYRWERHRHAMLAGDISWN